MKVWITKRALTSGVFCEEVEPPSIEHPRMIWVNRPGGHHETFHGNDWHSEESQAAARVNEMIEAKLAPIARQLKKFEGMNASAMVRRASLFKGWTEENKTSDDV